MSGLSEHAFRLLPYRGIGRGSPRSLGEWPQIELISEAGDLTPALKQHLVEMTQPDSPRSPTQKCRLTAQGKALLK